MAMPKESWAKGKEIIGTSERRAPVRVNPDHAAGLYNALLTIIRQNAQGFPVGHDAIVAGQAMLRIASGRTGQSVDWSKEKKAVGLEMPDVEVGYGGEPAL